GFAFSVRRMVEVQCEALSFLQEYRLAGISRLPEGPGTHRQGVCVPGEDETCPAGGLPGTLSIVQLVNSEVLVGMGLYVVCIGVHEGNGIAVAEIDNDIATNLRDTIGKIVCGRDIKAIDALLNLQNVFTGIEVENDVVSAATIEQECIAAISADKDIVTGTTIEDVVAVATLQDSATVAAKEKSCAIGTLNSIVTRTAKYHIIPVAAA